MQEAMAQNAGETTGGGLANLPLDEWTGATPLGVGLDYSPTPVLSTESFWESIRESATARVVLPEGVKDLDEAARRFLETLTVEQWTQLDQVFQDQVLSVRDGLQKALLSTTDLMRHLVSPLVSQAVQCLGNHLPITDVAQVEFSLEEEASVRSLSGPDLITRIQNYYEQAVPALRHTTGKRRSGIHQPVGAGGPGLSETPPPRGDAQPTSGDHCLLLIPASDSGKSYGEQAQQVLPDVHLVNVPGQADLMFCREQDGLGLEDLERILRACRPAYYEAATLPQASPHSRFDVQDWMPLDP
jgi:hypothetical protein